MKQGEVIQKYSPDYARLLLKLAKLSFKSSAILLYKNIKKKQKIECRIKNKAIFTPVVSIKIRNIDTC